MRTLPLVRSLPMRASAALAAILLARTSPLAGPASSIAVVGAWTVTINSSNLIAGAGSNLVSSQESPADTSQVSITNVPANWRIDVRRQDSVWNAALSLQVRRSSNGTGSGSISGGTSYVTLTTSDQTLCTGSLNRSGIGMQYQVAGLSLALPPNTYQTDALFTLVET